MTIPGLLPPAVCPAKHAGRFNLTVRDYNSWGTKKNQVSGAGLGSRASQWLVPPTRCQCRAVRPFPGTAKQQGGGEQFEDVGWKSESVDDGWMVPGWMMQCLDHVQPWSEVKWFWLQFVIALWPWNMPVIRYEEIVSLLSLPCASR